VADVVDLRSDTVTRPTAAMRSAMAEAEVGDDVFADDPTVLALQEKVAALFGHEAALFTPSGTMSNQIALQLVVAPGEELLADVDAHILAYEMGAAAALGGVTTRTYRSFDEIESMVRAPGGYTVGTAAIAVEQTHNLGGGTVIPLSALEDLRALADARGVFLHCDGARIWHAHVATGLPLEAYGRLFDTLSVCLSKGLGAPVGSLVIGSAARMERARLIRKRMGGGMRQAGILAAAGIYALDHHVDRLAQDHAKAERLAKALEPHSVWGGTNIVYLKGVDAPSLIAMARENGVLVGQMGPRLVRAIAHLDVDDAAIDRAADLLATALGVR
jgi:threonine aldolase